MSRSTTSRAATFVAALVAISCRFGGPSGDPTLPIVDGAGGFIESGDQAGRAGRGGGGGNAGSGGTFGGAGGAGVGGSAGKAIDASDDISYDIADDTARDGNVDVDVDVDAATLDVRMDAMSDGASADSDAPTACVPPFASAGCDPVCNTGCTALLRCDVADTPRTGVCVGTLLSTVTEGMACTRTAATDDCVERLSCVGSICRRLCYRDTDCVMSGSCCTMAIDVDGGASGYRFCAPCGP